MPELPEVETVVRSLRPLLVGLRFGKDVFLPWGKVIEPWHPEELRSVLNGLKVVQLSRRGKYICCECPPYFLVIHLRMTGRLYISKSPEGDDRWVRFSISLSDGQYLAFSDARKFGRINLVESLDFLEEKLGPEPLSLPSDAYAAIFKGSERPIKTFLLDQKNLAGVGNIYADEALFAAKIHPKRPVNSLTPQEAVVLGIKLTDVLNQGLRHEGATISWYRKPDGTAGESQKHFNVYGRTEEPCFLCGSAICRIVLGQRSTHFCPKCQS